MAKTKSEQDTPVATVRRELTGPPTQTERDRRAFQETVDQARREIEQGYWRTHSDGEMSEHISIARDNAEIGSQPVIEGINAQANVDLITREMREAYEALSEEQKARLHRRNDTVSDELIAECAREIAASQSTVVYLGEDGSQAQRQPHPLQDQIDAALARRGLPSNFKR